MSKLQGGILLITRVMVWLVTVHRKTPLTETAL